MEILLDPTSLFVQSCNLPQNPGRMSNLDKFSLQSTISGISVNFDFFFIITPVEYSKYSYYLK